MSRVGQSGESVSSVELVILPLKLKKLKTSEKKNISRVKARVVPRGDKGPGFAEASTC